MDVNSPQFFFVNWHNYVLAVDKEMMQLDPFHAPTLAS